MMADLSRLPHLALGLLLGASPGCINLSSHFGTPIFAQRVRGNWARVRTVRGELGWVYASLLEKR